MTVANCDRRYRSKLATSFIAPNAITCIAWRLCPLPPHPPHQTTLTCATGAHYIYIYIHRHGRMQDTKGVRRAVYMMDVLLCTHGRNMEGQSSFDVGSSLFMPEYGQYTYNNNEFNIQTAIHSLQLAYYIPAIILLLVLRRSSSEPKITY